MPNDESSSMHMSTQESTPNDKQRHFPTNIVAIITPKDDIISSKETEITHKSNFLDDGIFMMNALLINMQLPLNTVKA